MKVSSTSKVHDTSTTSPVLKKKPVSNPYHKDKGSIIISDNKKYRLIMLSGVIRALYIGKNKPIALKVCTIHKRIM